MKILFVVPYVPSLIRVRSYNLIAALLEAGHQVTVVAPWTDDRERQEVEDLRRKGWEVEGVGISKAASLLNGVKALPSRVPLQSVYSWSPALARTLGELASRAGERAYDVAHVEHLRGSRYGLYLNEARRSGQPLPIVWDSVDCITLLFRQASQQKQSLFGRFRSRIELPRTQVYEGWLLGQFSQALVTSPADKEALISLWSGSGKRANITVLPNGVDLNYFRPDPNLQRSPFELVLSGKMSYHANVTMALYLVEKIMPRVWAQKPEARLTIVGKDPPPEIQALARRPEVTVTGTVPDLRPYLQRAAIAVVPMIYGAGIQNKVLEAMACETPVVSTPLTITALSAVPGRDLLVASDPAGFAEAVLDLLDQPQRRQEIGLAGRRYVEATHDWGAIISRLVNVYHQAARQDRREESPILMGAGQN